MKYIDIQIRRSKAGLYDAQWFQCHFDIIMIMWCGYFKFSSKGHRQFTLLVSNSLKRSAGSRLYTSAQVHAMFATELTQLTQASLYCAR